MATFFTSKHHVLLSLILVGSGLNAYNDVHIIQHQACEHHEQSAILTTLYGIFTITEPILLELLQCPMMERLKNVRQYGPFYYTIKPVGFTRYDHSIGVLALLRRAGATLQEQVAGLIHDISHPVFSHGGGYAFRSTPLEADAHQDDNHAAFLRSTGIEEILTKYNYTIEDIHHKNPLFKRLERELPYLCADRIEYNIHGGLAEHLITEQEAQEIINHLIFEDDIWVFTNQASAKKFARISLWKTEHTWGSASNTLVNTWTGQALKRALDIGLLQLEDVLYGTDEVIWQLLNASNDSLIQEYLYRCIHHKELFLIDEMHPDTTLFVKFRGVDPLIKTQSGLKFLSEIDTEFKTEYELIKQKISRGWPVRFINNQS